MLKAKSKNTKTRPAKRGKSTTKPDPKKTFPDDPPDPAYAVVRAYHEAQKAHTLAVERHPDSDFKKLPPKEAAKRERDLQKAEDRLDEAIGALARTQPTTISGVAEIIEAYNDDWEQDARRTSGAEDPLFSTLAKALRDIAVRQICLAVRGG